MSKEINLNISERVACIKILNDFKGNLSDLAVILDDLKKIVVTPEEWEKAGLIKTPVVDGAGVPTGQENWNWQDKEELNKEIELNPATISYVENVIKTREENKEITMADVALISLKAKL